MKQKFKVLHVIASLENGGAERQLVELLKYNKNHGVILLTKVGNYKKSLESIGIKYWEFDVRNKALILLKIGVLKKILKEFKPDIVQAWMYNACIFCALCKFIKIYEKPLIWSIRCSDMITKYYSFKLKLIIYSCKLFSKSADKIVYNSFAGMNYHEKIGFNKLQHEVVFNGVDSQKFKFSKNYRKKLRNDFNFNQTDLVLLCVARVDPMKNYHNFLEAYEIFNRKNKKKIRLLLIGKDTEKLSLPKNCFALGMIDKVEKYYNVADIIILPSAFGEGFSNVLVEGMLTNLLPISTDIGDAKKIIGHTGFLMKGSSSKIIADQLQKIVFLKRSFIKKNGTKARQRAYANFSVKKMINSYYSIYKKVIV